MTDVLIRNVSDEALSRIDARSAAVGLSRVEYLRRQVEQQARREPGEITAAHFEKLRDLAVDLGDSDVMNRAW